MSNPSSAADAIQTIVRLAKLIDIALDEVGLNRSAYLLLSTLHHGTALASVMAERMAITQSNVSLIAKGLIKDGLIQHSKSRQDGRTRPLSITQAGIECLERANKVCAAELMTILDVFGPDDASAEEIFSSLKDFAVGLDEVISIRAALPAAHIHSIREVARMVKNRRDDVA